VGFLSLIPFAHWHNSNSRIFGSRVRATRARGHRAGRVKLSETLTGNGNGKRSESSNAISSRGILRRTNRSCETASVAPPNFAQSIRSQARASFVTAIMQRARMRVRANSTGPSVIRLIRFPSAVVAHCDVFTRVINHDYARPPDWHIIATAFRIDWLSVSAIFSKSLSPAAL